MMHAFRLAPLLLTVISVMGSSFYARADGWDTLEELPTDARIKLLHYDPNDIYPLTTRVGYQTNVEFSQHEEIETISVGDRSFWQIIPSGHRLFIRPVQENAATNMTVITNRRSYQFDLQSLPRKSKGVVYVARFIYPEEEAKRPHELVSLAEPAPPVKSEPPAPFAASPPPAAQPPVTVSLPPAPPPSSPAPAMSPAHEMPLKRNYLYTFSGSETAAPYEVFDDGLTTYMRYQDPTHPAPHVAMLSKDGRETPLPVYNKEGYFAVDAVAPALAVHSGEAKVFVYNEMLAPETAKP